MKEGDLNERKKEKKKRFKLKMSAKEVPTCDQLAGRWQIFNKIPFRL